VRGVRGLQCWIWWDGHWDGGVGGVWVIACWQAFLRIHSRRHLHILAVWAYQGVAGRIYLSCCGRRMMVPLSHLSYFSHLSPPS